MKIYTKTGDKGTTSLVGGDRAEKHDLRVWAYGTIDEVTSSIGLARAYVKEREISEKLLKIQKTLFEVGAELASVGTDYYKERIEDGDITFLEETIDKLDGLKPSYNGFIVPGGTIESAHLDVARTIVRRAERYISELKNYYEISDNLMKYTNRLSDGLYAMARYFDYKDIMEKVEENARKFNQNRSVVNNSQSEEIDEMMINRMVIDRETAKHIAEKCVQKSYEIGVPMVICVTDYSGNITLLERMDDSLLASIEIAMKKAYTAAALKAPTHELRDASLPAGELYGINTVDKIITFGGGFPLKVNGVIVGAIGVSGGTVGEDMKVAQFGVKAFEEVVTNGITK